jgi:hypothetical protein
MYMDENDENDGIYEAETEFQRAVQDALRDQRTGEVTVGVTDNERAVIMEIGDIDAAFTANEARSVADEIHSRAIGTNWEQVPTGFRDYVHDLADVVDSEKSVEEVEAEWGDGE